MRWSQARLTRIRCGWCDLTVADDRALGDRADSEDRRLRRVDHRGEAVDAEHPQVGDGEGRPRELRRRDLPIPHPLRQRPRVRGDLSQVLLVRIEDRRHHQRVASGHGDPDVHPRVELKPPIPISPIGPRMLPQRQRTSLDHHVVERGHHIALLRPSFDLRPSRNQPTHIDLRLEVEVRRSRLRLGHPPGDRRLELGSGLRS